MGFEAKAKVVHQGPGGGVETLPPAGDARREVLAQRTDALAEQAEVLEDKTGVHALDPGAFAIENEIAQHFNEMEVPAAQSEYAYKWEQRDPLNKFGNRHFLRSHSLGWRKVFIDDPDAKGLEHCQGVDGSVIVGDTILMRIPRGRYIQLRREEYLQTRRQEQAFDGELQDRAAKYGVRTYDNDTLGSSNPGWDRQMESRARSAQAQRIALQQLDAQIREGTVPGRPVGRR